MRFSHLFISLVLLFVVSGCEKDPLENQCSPLIGKWKWIGTTSFRFDGMGGVIEFPTRSQMIPSHKNLELEFFSQGSVRVKLEGNIAQRSRITDLYCNERNFSFSASAFVQRGLIDNDDMGFGQLNSGTDTLYTVGLHLLELSPPLFEEDGTYYYFVRQ